jgi:hypothetical protein
MGGPGFIACSVAPLGLLTSISIVPPGAIAVVVVNWQLTTLAALVGTQLAMQLGDPPGVTLEQLAELVCATLCGVPLTIATPTSSAAMTATTA